MTGSEDEYSDDSDGPKEDTLFIMMELCDRSLRDLFEGAEKLPFDVAWSYYNQIVKGIFHVHNNGWMHADLSNDNVLIGKDGFIKITDFGLAKPLHLNPMGDDLGSPLYKAPEVKNKELLGTYTDVYSLGILQAELSCQFSAAMECSGVLSRIRDSGTSAWGDSVLYKMLDHSPQVRPTLKQIMAISDETGIQFFRDMASHISNLGFIGGGK